LVVIFGALYWWFSWGVFGTLLLGIWWGKFVGTLHGSLSCDSPPNPWVKGLDFGGFGVLGLEEFLAGFLRFLLIWQVLVDKIMAMDSSRGVLIIPKVLFKSVELFRRSNFGFGGVDPLALFISSCPGYTGLTGALDRSNRCESLVGVASGELLDSCVFGSWCCWSVLGPFGVVFVRFCVVFSFLAGCVLGVFLFQGLKKSLRLSGTFVVRLL
jgi:hypothetical protein